MAAEKPAMIIKAKRKNQSKNIMQLLNQLKQQENCPMGYTFAVTYKDTRSSLQPTRVRQRQ